MGVKVDKIDDNNKKALKFAFNITDDSSTYIQSIFCKNKHDHMMDYNFTIHLYQKNIVHLFNKNESCYNALIN